MFITGNASSNRATPIAKSFFQVQCKFHPYNMTLHNLFCSYVRLKPGNPDSVPIKLSFH